MLNNSEFKIIKLSLEENMFDRLLHSVVFENTAKGRLGNHLVNMQDNIVPIVRTTTQYTIPAHIFSSVHHALVEHINHAVNKDLPRMNFNNALIEVYDSEYSKMNYHSDQNLDLQSDSYIGLFSCYEDPENIQEQHMRKLIVKEKNGETEIEVPLTQHSVILFSIETNNTFLHKITLDPLHAKKTTSGNRWLGVTFRTSKTYITFEDKTPYFSNGKVLKLADEEQKATFFKLRGQENRLLNFEYPELSYTLNVADTLMPIK